MSIRRQFHITGFITAAVTLAALMLPAGARAQADAQLTQYWAVPAYYNPAATGTTDFVRMRVGAKLQWLGIENAPQSYLVTADSPLKIGSRRIGLGVNFSKETLGLFSNILANVQASFKLRLFKGTLSIGLQGGYFNSKFKGSQIYIPDNDDYHQGNDTSLPTQDLSGDSFDFSAGLHYQHKYWSVGVSGLHLLEPTVQYGVDGNHSSDTQEYEIVVPRQLYFIADGNIPIRNTLFELQPSLLARTDFKGFGAEVTARARYNKFLSFGAGYRWKDAVCVMVGAEIKNFFLGYAFDYPLSAINKASSGSHEIIAGYSLKLDFTGKNKNRHRSIRLM
ncbi:MAG: type IX secretion system membrane protein PorP/SprF [Muribaculaceae bacterium]|nr:type IX secretion system membrane protein PorP/SprF [Muribaculaceae bacterium]